MSSSEEIFQLLLLLHLGFFRRILVPDYNTIRFPIFLHDFPQYAQQRNLCYLLCHHWRYSIVVRACSNNALESQRALALTFRLLFLCPQSLRTCRFVRVDVSISTNVECVIFSSVTQPWLFATSSLGI